MKQNLEIRNERRCIPILQDSFKLNSWQWPILGSPYAKYIVVELFDYTCPDCRKLAPTTDEAAKMYGGDFAVIALPVPMNSTCNQAVTRDHPKHRESCELARIAVSVWLADSGKFSQFHHWMMKDESAPSAEAAAATAKKLVGAATFERIFNSKRPSQYIKSTVRVYAKANAQEIPRLLFPKETLVRNPNKVEVIRRLIQRNFVD